MIITFSNIVITSYISFLAVAPKGDKVNAGTWTYYVCFLYNQHS